MRNPSASRIGRNASTWISGPFFGGTAGSVTGWKPTGNQGKNMIGELILRFSALAFLIGIFVFAFVINL
ncbi:MAG: hypothetical protein JO276_17780 [Sphingomonadaceae bacterium]|nr:hypothetical protein [Sphingomonadaceae bacterium]